MKDNLHQTFIVLVMIKLIHGILEILGAIFLFFASASWISNFTLRIFGNDLVEDPKDFIANSFMKSLSVILGSQGFWGIYLLVHGLINFGVSLCLIKRKLWAYPVVLVVLILFILYQIYKLSLEFSILLLTVTIIDIILVFLTWREYKLIKK